MSLFFHLSQLPTRPGPLFYCQIHLKQAEFSWWRKAWFLQSCPAYPAACALQSIQRLQIFLCLYPGRTCRWFAAVILVVKIGVFPSLIYLMRMLQTVIIGSNYLLKDMQVTLNEDIETFNLQGKEHSSHFGILSL